MTWQDMGTTDGVKRHILTFYRSKANADAKTGRMTVATVPKGDLSATEPPTWSAQEEQVSAS